MGPVSRSNNEGMHLDHLSYAAGPDGLKETAKRLGNELGATFDDGGFHPQFGTRNQILALSGGQYLEVVEVLDHPAADKAVFGQAVRARSAAGGGWLGWVIAVDDLESIEERMGRTAIEGHRRRPDGVLLQWHQIGVKDLIKDRQLPFFVHWESDPSTHPSVGGHEVQLLKLEIAGQRARVDDWLGGSAEEIVDDVDIEWSRPEAEPGVVAAVFTTARGEVRI